jgi:hypothetical protein
MQVNVKKRRAIEAPVVVLSNQRQLDDFRVELAKAGSHPGTVTVFRR